MRDSEPALTGVLRASGTTYFQDALRQVLGHAQSRRFHATLKHHPDNPHDSNAIGVWSDSLQLGWVPADETRRIHPYLVAGQAAVQATAQTAPNITHIWVDLDLSTLKPATPMAAATKEGATRPGASSAQREGSVTGSARPPRDAQSQVPRDGTQSVPAAAPSPEHQLTHAVGPVRDTAQMLEPASEPDKDSLGDVAPQDPEQASRVLRLIEFLRDLDALRHPPVRDIASYGLFRLNESGLIDATCVQLRPSDEAWLKLRYVELPLAPDVPDDIAPWLDCGNTPSPVDKPEVLDEPRDDQSQVVAADQEVHRDAAQVWVDEVWSSWSAVYAQAQHDKALYRKVFDQMQLLADNRDSLELVWGFSMLRWSTEGHTIAHPLFTVPVDIEMDSKRELVVTPIGALGLETLCLSNLSLASRAGLAGRRDLLEETPFDPWDGNELASVAREVVRMVSLNGIVQGEASPAAGAPSVDLTWTLFIRRKRPDYQGFLDLMRDLYSSGGNVPLPLNSLVIDEPMKLADGSAPSRAGERLLLPLPANEQQQHILELAQEHSGVVVQGPPGTGKSHTIANLISHFVAYGQRVLVVSEKEQALQVLAEKIPEGIRDLTVSVLGADADGRRRLEASINAIQSRVTQIQPKVYDDLIDSLTSELDRIDAQVAETTEALLQARRSETIRLAGEWPCGPQPSPEAAARWVASNSQVLAVIPDRVTPEQACPISTAELVELCQLARDIGADRAADCAYVLPTLERLPDAEQLRTHFDEISQAQELVGGQGDWVSDWGTLRTAGREGLATVHRALSAEAATRSSCEVEWLTLLAPRLEDELQRADWAEFTTSISADREAIFSLRPRVAAHNVQVPANPTPQFVAALSRAKERLGERGKLGMFAGELKEALSLCTVDGRIPSTAEEVQLCLDQVQLQGLREALARRWSSQVEAIHGPDLELGRPEDSLGSHLQGIEVVTTQGDRWSELAARLAEIGLRSDIHGSRHLSDLVSATAQMQSYFDELEKTAFITELGDYLAHGAEEALASEVWGQLRTALSERDFQSWTACRARVADLEQVAPRALQLRQTLTRLSSVAPVWAQQVANDPDSAGDADKLGQYWAWRQLDTWVNDIANSASPSQLQRRLEDMATQRRRKIAQLVEVRAWRRLQSQIRDPQRQALGAYLAAMKNHGKTGGKYKARWLKEIRDALNRSKDAVPVWIMPASRALTSFRPEKTAPFDVLIIDEASQLGIDAIPLLSLAKRAIVVGDDQQTSPSAVGVNQEEVHRLIDSHLRDVPNARVLFNAGDSLYDLAGQKFPNPVMLVEHFRSLPEIIEFSNRHVYHGKIEPLRDQRPSPDWPALGAVKVLDGHRSTGDTNANEAAVVADLVTKFVNDPDYEGKTVGVVSLLSTSGQSDLIRGLLFESLGPTVIEKRRIRVGDAAQFQGDERDIMVVALVVGTDPDNPTRAIGAMTDKSARQRINVATSRARDQMWVVHSVDPERFPRDDLRAELIRHAREPHAMSALLEDQLAKCDSEFERMVLQRIVGRGYRRVRAQVKVGAESNLYRIDLVVEGPTSRLAVECDGEKWHGPERWHQDRARQEILERAGWTFERIRGSAFFRNPDAALEPLWQRLEELGIPTGDDWLHQAQPNSVLEVRGLDLRQDRLILESGESGDVSQRSDLIEPMTVNAHTASSWTEEAIPVQAPKPMLAEFDQATNPHEPKTGAGEEPPTGRQSPPATRAPLRPTSAAPTAARLSTDLPIGGPRSHDVTEPKLPMDVSSPAPPATVRARENSSKTAKSETNRALAAALRALDKPANGATWMAAKRLLKEGKSIDEAANLA